MKKLIVTDKQLEIIKSACELYGRIQLGQFRCFAETVTQTGFYGWVMRIDPKKKDGETDKEYKIRCLEQYDKDILVANCLEGAIDGIYRNAYHMEGKPRTNESNISLDIWAALDGRREDGFHMGSEPLVKIEYEAEPESTDGCADGMCSIDFDAIRGKHE